MPRDIVVTGIGLVTPIGTGSENVLEALVAGRSGIVEAQSLGEGRHAAMVSGFDPSVFVDRRKTRRMEASNVYAIAACKMALEQAGIAGDAAAEAGLIVGTGFSGFLSFVQHYQKLLDDGIANLTPIHFPGTVSNASAGLVAIELGLKGPNSTVTGIGTPGEYAALYGAMLLELGATKRIVVAGTEGLGPELVRGFADLGMLSDDTTVGDPYSPSSRGCHAGEGSAALVLETEASAKERGAPILGRIRGFGMRQTAAGPLSFGSDGKHIEEAARASWQDAGFTGDPSWISGSANGEPGLGRIESQALAEFAPGSPIRALKGHVGEASSGGVMRMAMAILASSQGLVPTSAIEPAASVPPSSKLARIPSVDGSSRILHLGTSPGGGAFAIALEVSP